MLKHQSDNVRVCYDRAAEAQRKAQEATDAALKAELLDMERRWLLLARSYQFCESLADFTAANADRKRYFDERLRKNARMGGARTDDGRDIGLTRIRDDNLDTLHVRIMNAASPAEEALRQLNVQGWQRTDLIERGRMDIALRESEERFRWLASIIESSDDAIISKNLQGIIRSWNRGAERVFGYTAEEAIGKPITMLIPADRQGEEDLILERLRRGEHIEHFETIRQRKHGSLIVVSLTISPVKDAQGKIVGASKIARDITEQRRAAEQISMLAREADYRTKNVLATVQATVNLSHADTPGGLKRAIEGRLRALANVHALFVESRWAGAELSSVVRQELAPYLRNADGPMRIEGPEILLEPSMAQIIAITVHELATNAVKYGALSVEQGRVEIKWSVPKDGRLVLNWVERGGPPVNPPTRKGFGMTVIERSIKGQARGKMKFDWRTEGLACEIAVRM